MARSVLLCMLMQGAVYADDPEEPEAWLNRMDEAVEYLNYHGTLVYMRPGKADMFRVYHRVADHEVTERVVEMDGLGAEIIRTSDEVICIFPAQRSVVVDKRTALPRKQNPLRANLPEYSASLASHYQFELLESERLLDRTVVVVAIQPRDEYRYGYRLWLDYQTAMPLKSQMIGADENMPIEEIRFSAISMPPLVGEDMVRPSRDTTGYRLIRHGNAPSHTATAARIPWRAVKLPPGFMQTVAMREYMEGVSEPRVHLVYSDGLASVSVFIDVGVAASEQVEGLSMVGASNAYSVMKEGMLVTAIGEVPPPTARQIALSMIMTSESD
ncbi:MAG: MucB/RseB C-terminal domain-containing protein [Gammaproteobacteria bacterium]|nr:MucB/RseB C-terminal domain-containing protein [Gammaproteobacteria bacterium]MDP6615834.1 MucB/RseB C-terminal domain-containing protein [Gammaproteobacteria bacterium]MDP6694348.1 MucB/RseB C-terminal domain-containing protein [Gammaproteobacteria bacterium]